MITLQTDNSEIKIDRIKDEDRTVVLITSKGALEKEARIPIVTYPMSISRRRIEFSPIYRDMESNIVINSHIIISTKGHVTVNDNLFLHGNMAYQNTLNGIASRTIIDSPLYAPLVQFITGNPLPEGEENFLTPETMTALFDNAERIPPIFQQKLGNLSLWEIADRETVVYRAILRKVYQLMFENLTQNRLIFAMRKLNASMQENMLNPIQARAVLDKVEIPWKSKMTQYLTEDCNLILNDTPQSGKAGLIVAIPHKEKNGLKFSYTQSLTPFAESCPANRQVVARYVAQTCQLIGHDWTFGKDTKLTDEDINLGKNQKRKLHVARMCLNGDTLEDGAVISESAAMSFLCYQTDTERFTGIKPTLKVSAIESFKVSHYMQLVNGDYPFVNNHDLGMFEDGRRIASKFKGLITALIVTKGEMENEFHVTVETTSILRLKRGDKLADLHGNKVTIARIMPDEDMPMTGDRQRLDLIVPPWIGKRASASRVREEQHSVKFHKTFVHDVVMDKLYYPVAVGHISYIRLAQHASKKLNWSEKTRTNYLGMVPRGYGMYSFADGMYHMMAVGANDLLMEIFNQTYETNSPEILKEYLNAFGFDLVKGQIIQTTGSPFHSKPDSEIILSEPIDNRPIPEHGIAGTVTDDRALYAHSWIRIPSGIPLTFHAMTSKMGSRSYDIDHVLNDLGSTDWWIDRYDISAKQVIHDGVNETWIMIPPGLRNWQPMPDSAQLSDLQQQIDQLLIQIRAYEKAYNPSRNMRYRLNQLVNKLFDSINQRIFTKNGIIRRTIHPRVKFSLHAVLRGDSSLKLDECELPFKAILDFMKVEEWRKAYGVPDNYQELELGQLNEIFKRRCSKVLVMRNPAHQVRNLQGLKLRVGASDTITIHPAIVKTFDGDFDSLRLRGRRNSLILSN